MGTDESGLPTRAYKSTVDGKYHLLGQLQVAPRTAFSTVLADAAEIMDAACDARIVLVAPFARYVSGKCCDDPVHITNYGTDAFFSEMYKAADAADAAVAASANGDRLTIYHMLDTFTGTDSDLTKITTTTGASAWRNGDPVHLSDEAYTDVAAAILKVAADAEGQGAAKRPRLASVVPSLPPSVRGEQAAIRPPLWVTGQASRARPRGGGGYRRPYGGRGGRGGGRSSGRGRWVQW